LFLYDAATKDSTLYFSDVLKTLTECPEIREVKPWLP